ncbi:MAG TPA: sensor histidine kinase [Gaiellaceae bacterium]|nr:sensor histidine kinase [Gaiellaceae bacterium]
MAAAVDEPIGSAFEPDEPGTPQRVVRRLGQLLGLLFLIGPVVDLAQGSGPDDPARLAAVWVLVGAFVALYLALLPPARPLLRHGPPAIFGALVLLGATASAALLVGAPSSFVALYVYVVAAAGILLPPRVAVGVVAVIAAAVAGGLAAAGAGEATIASLALTIVAVGFMMAAFRQKIAANHELLEAREERARLAVAEERLRIARDLHDLLGHSLSLVALKGQLASKLLDPDPERARAELEEIQQVARQALTEVREAVQGYRRLALEEAVDGARAALAAAGIDCRVDAATVELPSEVEDVVAWAVREATTNVVRHSGARACAIRLQAAAGRVELAVEDDGRAGAPAGGGTGLRGLAERAERLRGSLEAGARPGGGFRLRLTVPLPA